MQNLQRWTTFELESVFGLTFEKAPAEAVKRAELIRQELKGKSKEERYRLLLTGGQNSVFFQAAHSSLTALLLKALVEMSNDFEPVMIYGLLFLHNAAG